MIEKIMTKEQRDRNEEVIKAAIRELGKEGYGYRVFAKEICVKYQTFRNFMSGSAHTSDFNLLILADVLNNKYNKSIELETLNSGIEQRFFK